MNSCRFHAISFLVATLILSQKAAAETVFDNLDTISHGVTFIDGVTGFEIAQPFLIGNNTTITSVTINAQRFGNPAGEIEFDIWNADGGLPGSKLANVASLASLLQPTTQELTFDVQIDGLQPNATYFAVVSYLDPNSNATTSFDWATTDSDNGTMGAGNGLFRGMEFEGKPVEGWASIAEVTLGTDAEDFADFFQLQVTAVATLTVDFDGNGDVDAADVDSLIMEIAAGMNTDTYDLSGDGLVDRRDLTHWLSAAANHNGFSEAYLSGDSNLDGTVDNVDLNNLALTWRQDIPLWSGGDFTADGNVGAADLNELALNWQKSIPLAASPVPEPSTLLLTSVIGIALLWRRSYIVE